MKRKLPKPFSRVLKNQGFTLLEVIVTMTILGFLLLVVYGVFSMGRSAWERGDLIREKYQKSRILSQLISRQIKSAVPFKVKAEKAEGNYLVFEGTAQSLKFVSALSLRNTRPEGLIYAVYEYREGGDEGGKLVVYEQRALTRNFMEEKPKEESGISLLEEISSVRFEYYREGDPNQNREAEWVEEWNAKEEMQLPRALRITITPRKGQEGKEEMPITVFAAVPATQFEEIRTGPTRRVIPQTPQRTG
ncbi:MAG: gspJ2 [Deltaproteobacteria bacterium]|nr:gspJ2 [Deltaproteobacteria bacterium]